MVDIPMFVRQGNALMSYYFKIPFPEKLTDEEWVEKWKQLEWLSAKKIIGGVTEIFKE